MNQDDIYNLLLLLLLMSNERDGNDNSSCRCNGQSTRGSLNELIIASMLMSNCNGRDAAATAELANSVCNGAYNNRNTTF